MKQYELKEWIYTAKEPKDSQISIDLILEICNNQKCIKIKGFYSGNNKYIIRYLPINTGIYHWKVSGIFQEEGSEYCYPSEIKKGMVRTKGTHFKFDNGDKYLPFGTTIYALIHQSKALIDKTMNTLSQCAFNKVRMCIFPKHLVYNANEPLVFPFEKLNEEWDFDRPNMVFWDELEATILKLEKINIQCDLILFHPYDRWGFSKMSKESCIKYIDYLLRRLAAYPNIWWSLANEYDTMPEFELSWWNDFSEYIMDNDPYKHLMSIHNCMVYWDFNTKGITHCCIQDENIYCLPDYLSEFKKPVIFDECGYEGNIPYNWGNLSAFQLVDYFWTAVTLGGYCSHGETFLDKEDIMWWSKGGKLKGQSHSRIKFLKELVESFPRPLEFLEAKEDHIERLLDLKTDPSLMKNIPGLAKGLYMKPYERIMSFIKGSRKIQGHCDDEVFLYYLGRHCSGEVVIELPKNNEYDIYVIDVWEMSYENVRKNVSGKIKIDLPGKVGIAVLARKLKK